MVYSVSLRCSVRVDDGEGRAVYLINNLKMMGDGFDKSGLACS